MVQRLWHYPRLENNGLILEFPSPRRVTHHSQRVPSTLTKRKVVTEQLQCSKKKLFAGESYTYGLQLNLYQPRTLDSYARYYFSKDNTTQRAEKEMSLSTVCYRFWILQFRDISPFLSYAFSDRADNAFMFFQKVDTLDFYFNDEKEYSQIVLDDTLEVWHHHCLVFTHPTYKLYVDGKFAKEGRLGADSGVIPLNGTLYLGHDQDSYDGGRDPEQTFSGYLSQVNIWDYLLNEDDIKNIAECRINLRGNIISSDITPFETSQAEIDTAEITTFCQASKKAIFIPEQMYPDQAIEFCKLADAVLYLPENSEENTQLVTQAQLFNDICVGNSYRLMYLGVTDNAKEGEWLRVSDGQPMAYSNWFVGEPNGDTKDNCVVLRRNDDHWGDIVCDYELCFACGRTHEDYLQLRGLCEEKEHQTRFALEGHIESKPYFRGYYSMMIYYSGNKDWFLINANTNTTLASLSFSRPSQYPIGRHTWQVQSPFCTNLVGDSVVLGLSICTTQQFMCTDGSCVHRSVRCNLLDDCLDRSDEENCTLVVLSDMYQNYKPPPGQAFGIPLKIAPEVNLVRFSQIDDLNLAFSLEIEVALVWIDRNVRFNNLKSEEGKNQLSEEEVEAIWTPRIEFLNINDGRLQLLKSGVYARQVGDPDPPVFTDVTMDTIYQPKSSRLVQRQQYYASFNCQFYLFSYPFDTQTCQIIIKLASADRKVIDLENATVTYSGLRYLSKYEVKNMNILLVPTGGYAVMEVTFDLERRYSLLVLTVFLPTFLLLGIGYGTLYIKPKDFDVRSMMSLTTLLVLYTMFDQVSSNLPDTAYIKMVDLWFFFCIFVIFSINLVHIAVEFLPPGDEDDDIFRRRDLVSPVIDGSVKFVSLVVATGLVKFVSLVVATGLVKFVSLVVATCLVKFVSLVVATGLVKFVSLVVATGLVKFVKLAVATGCQVCEFSRGHWYSQVCELVVATGLVNLVKFVSLVVATGLVKFVSLVVATGLVNFVSLVVATGLVNFVSLVVATGLVNFVSLVVATGLVNFVSLVVATGLVNFVSLVVATGLVNFVSLVVATGLVNFVSLVVATGLVTATRDKALL
ncbi:uncharacterized protein [Palaemon carinicauda]|uniref:uncharacterized protein n=1 Tax=Palaemon carinicauda TaxID=392227 RepID=UPI0035B57810